MTIALDRGLENLAGLLEREGHKVVPLYGYKGGLDAVVYHNEGMDRLTLTNENYGTGGVLVVCAKNQSPEQILKILNCRNYSGGSILEF